jgi:hypothetical protein
MTLTPEELKAMLDAEFERGKAEGTHTVEIRYVYVPPPPPPVYPVPLPSWPPYPVITYCGAESIAA